MSTLNRQMARNRPPLLFGVATARRPVCYFILGDDPLRTSDRRITLIKANQGKSSQIKVKKTVAAPAIMEMR